MIGDRVYDNDHRSGGNDRGGALAFDTALVSADSDHRPTRGRNVPPRWGWLGCSSTAGDTTLAPHGAGFDQLRITANEWGGRPASSPSSVSTIGAYRDPEHKFAAPHELRAAHLIHLHDRPRPRLPLRRSHHGNCLTLSEQLLNLTSAGALPDPPREPADLI